MTTLTNTPPLSSRRGAAVEEESESNNKDEEMALPSYAQLLKDNGFINISVHGDTKRK